MSAPQAETASSTCDSNAACEGGSGDKAPGLISWSEIVSTNLVGSLEFYTALFGWKAEEMDMGGFKYTFLKNPDGKGVAGLFGMPPEAKGAPTMWINYITVPNLEIALARAAELGAKICKDATEIPMGRFAIINDPQGATVGLWQFKS